MRENRDGKNLRRKLLFSLLMFVVSYVIFLMVWINIKDYYGRAVLTVASYATAEIRNIEYVDMKLKENGETAAEFFISRKGKRFFVDMNFDFLKFTYNAPLTFAIMAALFLFIKKHVRAYGEAAAILFLIHFSYMFTSEAGRIAYMLARNNLESASEFGLFIWQYLWGFIDAMFIRFEPFLIGFYLYARYSASPLFRAKKG
jgi:hypothetical protein